MLELDRGRSAALRAKLLLGVAGATAVATSAAYADQTSAPAPADQPKWTPYSSIGGSTGSGMTGGKLDFFVPIFQNLDSIAFLNLGVGTETKANVLYNIGVGYRTKVDGDWIVGGYVGHDGTQLSDNNTIGQTSVGIEAMSADWDARLNAYIADNAPKPIPGQYGLYINGTTIGILQGQDVGYTGFDGEVGYRVFSTDDTDVRVFVGGFHFSHANTDSSAMGQSFDFGYRDMSGPKARAEATVYDLDVIGNQSRLTLDAEIAHDDVRGTTGFFGATLRIPLGNFSGGAGAQALDELDRRMVDPERHNDMVVTRSQFTKPEPVIIYGAHVTSQPTNTLLYVNGASTGGVGTYANPTTLADAVSRNTTNAFIVLDSKGGPIKGGVALQPGQTLVPGGNTFTVEGEFSHAKFTHLFDPSAPVTVTPATAGGTVFTLANNTSLYGFTIKGDFGTAIYGKNVDNVNVSNVTIDGTGGGQTGIAIRHTASGEENVTINNVAISNLTEDGIDLTSNIADGGSSTETFKLNNITISNVGHDGIYISDDAANGSKITSGITLSNVAVTNAYYAAVGVYANANGAGSSVKQTLTASNVTATNTTGYNGGIAVTADAGNGGQVTQNASITNATVANSGLYIGASSFGAGSSVSQSVTVSGFTDTTTSYGGIAIDAFAINGGAISQTTSLSNVTLTGGAVGIDVYGSAFGAGAQLSQSLTASNVAISDAASTGIYIHAYGGGGATLNQSASITGATISNTGSNALLNFGIEAYAYAEGAGTVVTQTVNIANTSVTGAIGTGGGGAGMEFVAAAEYGAAAAQYLTLTNVSVTHSADRIDFPAAAVDNGGGVTTAYQSATITGATASNNAGAGIFVFGYAISGHAAGYQSQAAVSQNISIIDATLSHDKYGIDIRASVSNGASVSQNLSAYGIDIDHSVADGVLINNAATYVGSLTQSVTLSNAVGSYNEITYNGGNGADITNAATKGGQINQHLYIYNTNFDHNALDGVRIKNASISYYFAPGLAEVHYSHIQLNMIAAYDSASSNGGNGISIQNTVKYGGAEDEFIYLLGVKLDKNTLNGFYEKSVLTTFGPSYLLPTDLHSKVYIINSDLSYNGLTGATIASKVYGPGYYLPGATSKFPAGTSTPTPNSYSEIVQYVTIAGSTFTKNTGSGLEIIAEDYGLFTLDEQIVSISGSKFTNNGGDGADFVSKQTYGYGPYGDAIQFIKISNSDFGHNVGNGLYALAGAYGVQGRSEQYFTVENSTFNYNKQNGIYLNRVAEDGVLIPGFQCYKVQNPGGGCAFVRETFDMVGGSASNNGNYGIYVRGYANNYGALYAAAGRPAHVPTVYLKSVTADYNSRGGFYSNVVVNNHSYAYNYIVAIGSMFDHNATIGFKTNSYADNNSTIIERNALFSYKGTNSASYNGAWGVALASRPANGSFVQSTNIIYGLTAEYNGADGVHIGAQYVDGTSFEHQYNYIGLSNISFNHADGLNLITTGPGAGAAPGAGQYNRIGNANYGTGNIITHNGAFGIYGAATFGAYQLVNVYTNGNTVAANGFASYDFLTALGGFHNIY